MGVRRRDVDFRWFASLGLIVLGSLIFRLKTVRDKHLHLSLKDAVLQHWYTPSWMQLITKQQTICQDSLREKPTLSPSETAKSYFAQKQYSNFKWAAERLLFR